MKKYFLNLLFIIIAILITKIESGAIFPGPKSYQEQLCVNETNPSVEKCRSIEKAHQQDACCYVTYKDRNNTIVTKCGYLENTEFGIKVYKNIYNGYGGLKILCEIYYIKNNILFSFLIIFLFI